MQGQRPTWAEKRERDLRAQPLYELQLERLRPPCSRHDDGADDAAERTKLVWAYAMGLLGSHAKALLYSSMIARLHDHKGTLSVVLWPTAHLPEGGQDVLRRAWWDMAGEPDEEDVVFVRVGSEDWRTTWSSRRFASDWSGEDR